MSQTLNHPTLVFQSKAALGLYERIAACLKRNDETNARVNLITLKTVAAEPHLLLDTTDEEEILAGAAFLAAIILGDEAADESFPTDLVELAEGVCATWCGLLPDLYHAAIALDVALYRYRGVAAANASWLGRKVALRRVRTLIGQAIEVADPILTIVTGGSTI